MKRDRMEDLALVTRLCFEREFEAARPVFEEEVRLRADIARLDAQAAAAGAAAGDDGMAAIGADVLWLNWVARTRADLNAELARVLARKEALLPRLRTAFGRHRAIGDMRDAVVRPCRGRPR